MFLFAGATALQDVKLFVGQPAKTSHEQKIYLPDVTRVSLLVLPVLPRWAKTASKLPVNY